LPVTIRFLGHATVQVRMAGVDVLTDPLLRRGVTFLRRQVPAPPPGSLRVPDVVVVSHLHHDHCDLPTLRLLARHASILAPAGSAAWLQGRGVAGVVELATGEVWRRDGLVIQAVHAEHSGRREPLGPTAAAVGYVLHDHDGRRVWFAGDTALFDGMTALLDDMAGPAGVDVALVPVWGWGPNLGPGHLDPVEAAEAVARVRATVAVPIHWGAYLPMGTRRWLRPLLDEPPRRFVDEVRRRVPGCHPVLLRPGERLTLRRDGAVEVVPST
jgi:L-ascorbate metabolism protein UlaG (beta-lactamase superfamily)